MRITTNNDMIAATFGKAKKSSCLNKPHGKFIEIVIGGHVDMDKNLIFARVQKCLENVPAILVGTGGTIPLGIPGMDKLSEHLVSTLSDKYKTNTTWNSIVIKLKSGIDLESALTDITFTDDLVNDIVIETWKLIIAADTEVFNKYILGKQALRYPI